MQIVTIKNYAVQHKLSIFNVMKMVKSGKLKSTTMDKNGKEQIYIILDDAIEEEIKNIIIAHDEKDTYSLYEEVRLLKNEVAELKSEIAQILKKLD